MLKCIIFDLDGVILDSEPLHFRAHQAALKNFGITLTFEDYLEFGVAKGDANLYEKVSQKYGAQINREKVSKLKKQLFRDLINQGGAPLEGVKEVLEKWSEKHVLAVASSGAREMVEFVLQKMDLKKYFSIVVTGDDVEKVKPHPDVYLKAIESCGFPKEECLAIEDSESGLLAAKAAGLKCVVIPCELTKSQNFSQADLVLEKIADLNVERLSGIFS